MNSRKLSTILLILFSLVIILACGSSTSETEGVRTLVAPTEETVEIAVSEATSTPSADTSEPTAQPTATSLPPTDTPAPTEDTVEPTTQPTSTPVPPTNTPAPTPTQEIEGLIQEGTHLIPEDIEPGIYVGLAGTPRSCYWERQSCLDGTFSCIIANDNANGLFYIEVLESDRALQTRCELLPIDKVPPPDPKLEEVGPGTYLVGRDIDPGIWRGETTNSCYWERLSCLHGGFSCINANDNARGQFYVEVLNTDQALSVACELVPIEKVPAPDARLIEIGPGTYLVGRDIDPGTWRGQATDSCYWERLSCLHGGFSCINANDNSVGQFYVEVLGSDEALSVACDLERVQ